MQRNGSQFWSLAFARLASASTIYNNLNLATDYTVNGVASDGPLFDSFSTGATGFSLASVGLLLYATTPTDGGSITVALFSSTTASPPGAESFLDTIGTISDSSLTTSPVPYFLNLSTPISLAGSTRYWIELSNTYGAPMTAYWTNSSDQTAQGVTGEFYETAGISYPNSKYPGPFQMELSNTPLPTAEPGTFVLFGVGLLAGLWFERKRILTRST